MSTDSTEIWLYGSVARGDDDDLSDLDILIAGEGPLDFDLSELEARRPLSVSRYSWDEVEQMARYGSLFLHHVKSEGRPVKQTSQRRMSKILASLPAYRRSDLELDSFRQVLLDVRASLEHDHSNAYELSVIATAARHAAILACYLLGMPNFGRESSFETALPALGYDDVETQEFLQLYRFRRAEDEGVSLGEEPDSGGVLVWVERVERLISQVRTIDQDG